MPPRSTTSSRSPSSRPPRTPPPATDHLRYQPLAPVIATGAFAVWLLEHDRLAGVDQHAVLQVPAHRAGEHRLLEVAALADQVVDRVAMRDPDRALLDDRSLIELGGHVVAGRADQLDALLERLAIRMGAGERG